MKAKTLFTGHIRVTDRDGVALLLALVFITLMAALVFAFLFEMQVDASFAQNQGADFEALLAARSAVVSGMQILAEHYADMQDMAMPPVDSELDGSQWSLGVPFEPLNDATMHASISDEYGKINLNALILYENGVPEPNEPLIQALRHFFLERSDSDYDPVDAILDWLDYDDGDSTEPDGAESDYYLSLESPYPCKNGPMDSIEELLLIKGITPELYFGNAEEQSGSLPQEPLSEYLTVHGDWEGRVNVNTAREEVISALVGGHTGTMDPALGQQIYEEARIAPMENASQLRPFLPMAAEGGRVGASQRRVLEDGSETVMSEQELRREQRLRQNDAVDDMFRYNSNVFRIRGDGQMDDVLVRVEAFVFREPFDPREIEEPLSSLGIQYQQEFTDAPRQLFRILDWKVVQ
ncbi:MAG: general secretion pathway protein GspK [Candidatus Hydrogenedens sp.]|nr:general secretion pathway protein GspK [Candidatus Hydrogenedens sp.]